MYVYLCIKVKFRILLMYDIDENMPPLQLILF